MDKYTMIINKLSWMIKFIVVMLMLPGCTQESRTAQSVVSIYSEVTDARNEIRVLVENVSKKEGFLYMTQAGNSKYLAKSGQYQILFIDKTDESFVSINNVLEKSCIRLSVYSAQGKEESKKLLDKLKKGISDKMKEGSFIFKC